MSRFAGCPLRGRACRPDRRRLRGVRPGKDLRAQAFALGAAVASAAEGAGRMGRRGRKGIRRHAALQGLSLAAARQGLRPLRHGARRHRRPHLHQSRLSARPLPDHRRRRTAVPDVERQGRLGRARRLVPQIRGQGDEGRQVLPRLRARPGLVPFGQQEDHGARRHQGHEDPAGAGHHRRIRHACSAAPTCRRRRRKCATCWPRASPTR